MVDRVRTDLEAGVVQAAELVPVRMRARGASGECCPSHAETTNTVAVAFTSSRIGTRCLEVVGEPVVEGQRDTARAVALRRPAVPDSPNANETVSPRAQAPQLPSQILRPNEEAGKVPRGGLATPR